MDVAKSAKRKKLIVITFVWKLVIPVEFRLNRFIKNIFLYKKKVNNAQMFLVLQKFKLNVNVELDKPTSNVELQTQKLN